jgi:uncharacterized membrane-anchored protein
MMKLNWAGAAIALGALLVLGTLNFAIVGKERIRRDGEIVYLRLMPVDPRSLMQGDYMALRFALAHDLEDSKREPAIEGATRIVDVTLDENGVAQLAKPGSDERRIRLRYRFRNGHVWLGTNAFFFEEGNSDLFNGARFGEFRVDRKSGEAVLVGLRDEAMKAM